MNKISDKKLLLVIILVFLSLAINFRPLVMRMYKNYETEKLAEHPFSAGQCLVQYDACAFNKEKEPWQDGCSPFKSFYKINQVGQKKYLVTEVFKDGRSEMKELDKLDVHRVRDQNSADKNYYDIDCSEVEIKWELSEPTKDLEGEFEYNSLIEKCIAIENDCDVDSLERWELESYCHPFDSVYKVLEVGKSKLRVVTWFGHANNKSTKQITPIGEEKSINKSDYEILDFKTINCSDLTKKYPKGFDSVSGRKLKTNPKRN